MATEHSTMQERKESVSRLALPVAFDAEIGTPRLVDQVQKAIPAIRELMSELRSGIPLMPHCGVGSVDGSAFFRLPNHYRSISQVLRSRDNDEDLGVMVFKGTEPLIPDFPSYLGWMLEAPFRSSPLPIGLQFPLDMKLPPGAMWIEECIAEQQVSSALQQRYLDRHGSIARLPVPLFVFRFAPEQNSRYRESVRAKLSADAYNKIKNKIADGFGVEVYYYPELPVRVADLSVGNVRESFKAVLGPEQIEKTFEKWTRLFAEMLCLEAMPYASWHKGMGSCMDMGNACIDGGFNDLLTLVSFDSIPSEMLFRNSLNTSIKVLAETIVGMAAASLGMPSIGEQEVTILAAEYVTAGLRERILELARSGYVIDERLRQFFYPPTASRLIAAALESQQRRMKPGQYLGATQVSNILSKRAAAG